MSCGNLQEHSLRADSAPDIPIRTRGREWKSCLRRYRTYRHHVQLRIGVLFVQEGFHRTLRPFQSQLLHRSLTCRVAQTHGEPTPA